MYVYLTCTLTYLLTYCRTDCVSLSLHLAVRFHCLVHGSATRDAPSTRRGTQHLRSVGRLLALTGRPDEDCVVPLGHWRDHVVERWIVLDRVLALLTEVGQTALCVLALLVLRLICFGFCHRKDFETVKTKVSPVSIQTQSLALRALRKRAFLLAGACVCCVKISRNKRQASANRNARSKQWQP